MDWETGLRLWAGAFLILANGFFVTTEFALTRLRQFSAEEMEEDPGLSRAWQMTEQLELYLTGCQVGITFSSVLLGIVAEPALTHVLEPLVAGLGFAPGATPWISVVSAVALLNFAHTIYGEQVPTYLGVERPQLVARWLAGLLYGWSRLMYPFIQVADWIAKRSLAPFGIEITRSWMVEEPITSYRELKREVGELLSRGFLSEDRQREVMNALEIGQVPVSQIMVPRSEIQFLQTFVPLEENRAQIARHPKTRMPLVDPEGVIRGIIYVPVLFRDWQDLEAGRKELLDCARKPLYISPETPVSEVIDRLQEANEEVALLGRPEEVVGLVTITDAFEEIAGQVRDPFD